MLVTYQHYVGTKLHHLQFGAEEMAAIIVATTHGNVWFVPGTWDE